MLPAVVWFYFCLPEPLFQTPYSTVLLDQDGKLLGAVVAQDEQWRFPKTDSVPYKFEQSILHFEDRHFYYHPGVNPVSMVKALLQNVQAGKVVRGGSTLSMQVIRLARQGQERTYLEKIYESILALRLDLRYSKAEILQLYVSQAPFGGNVVGLEAASWRYYNRPPHHLSWSETATLAVLPNAPSLIFPGKNHKQLAAKRDRLLDKLVTYDIIDDTTAELAKAEPLPGKPYDLPQKAPHVLTHFAVNNSEGIRAHTTLDEQLHTQVTRVVQNHYNRLKQNEIYNAAALIVDTKSGQVKAYVGNTDDPLFRNENSVDIIQSVRSSGSTLKPFLYAEMQQRGQLLPQALLPDIPTYISGYAPKNFDESFDGAVAADEALARSLNVPAVRMLQDYGVEIFHHDLQTMGFGSINRSAGNYGLSLILGGAEVRLWDLVSNYRKMALSILQHHEPDLELKELSIDQQANNNLKKLPVAAGASWLTLEALRVMDRPIEGSDWRQFNASKTIAWKTGTSFGHKDAWAIGVTPDYVVGVWVGNADGEGRPGLTGASTAAPLMFDIYRKLDGEQWFTKPESDLGLLEVCTRSGYKASMICPETSAIDVSLAGTQTATCPYHERVYLDAQGQFRVNSDCYSVTEMVAKPWFVLPPVMEWYYTSTDPYYKKLPDYAPNCMPQQTLNFDLVYPQPNARLFVPRGFSGEKEYLVFEATHRLSSSTLHWHLNDQYISSTKGVHQVEVQPEAGEHELTLVSESGETLSRKFHVITR
ncbi:penicillin-binding protein 1C [Fulvivirga sp. RKSG066]|nr:penicillin-binding protein 1C [Fulvivirga aurantia]